MIGARLVDVCDTFDGKPADAERLFALQGILNRSLREWAKDEDVDLRCFELEVKSDPLAQGNLSLYFVDGMGDHWNLDEVEALMMRGEVNIH